MSARGSGSLATAMILEQHDEPAAVPISRMLRQFGPSTSGRRSYKTTRPFVVGQLLQNFW